MTVSGVSGVQARISEIRSRFGAPVSRTASGQASFAEVYADATVPSTSSGPSAVAPTPAAAPAPPPTGESVIAEAQKYLGVRYVFGSSNPAVGLDCSGLVKRVFAAFGISLPHLANSQAAFGTPVTSLTEARRGDLVAFNNTDDPSRPYIDHIGIYVGDGMMIHAPRTGGVVEYARVPTGQRGPVAIRRLTAELPPAPPLPEPMPPAQLGGLTLPASAVLVGPAADLTPVTADTPHAELFNETGARYQIAPRLLAAAVEVAAGPGTAWGVNPVDPAASVDTAGRMLAAQLDRAGTIQEALDGFIADLGAVGQNGAASSAEETIAQGRRILQLIGRNQ